jgi:HAD superfamily hydrolase (TIGR01549 family)
VAGYNQALADLGWPEPDREAVRRTVGYTLEQGYTMLTGDGVPARQQRFRNLFAAYAHELQPATTKLFPGAVELLERLSALEVPAAIVSTKHSEMLHRVLERQNALGWFRLLVGGEEVSAPKPDPEGLLYAMERLGVAPADTLYCGDTVMDAQAAQRAGAAFAAVLNGTTPAEAFAPFPHVTVARDLYALRSFLGI